MIIFGLSQENKLDNYSILNQIFTITKQPFRENVENIYSSKNTVKVLSTFYFEFRFEEDEN